MESGLFGIPELHTGRGHGTTPDYLHQCLSPVDEDAYKTRTRTIPPVAHSGTISRKGSKRGVGATAEELGNNHARILVDALSNPELIQILAKFHIRDPSGVPFSRGVPRNELLDLVVQHDEALAEVVRLYTPAAGERGIMSPGNDKKRKPKMIQISSDRVASGGYKSILNMYSAIHNPPDNARRRPDQQERRSKSATPAVKSPPDKLSNTALSYDLRSGAASTAEMVAHDKRRHTDSRDALPQEGKSVHLREARRKYHRLKSLLSETRREREDCTLKLAKQGLLGFALDSDMNRPIMIGRGFEVETVRRNQEATGGFHFNRFSKDLTGVYVDPIQPEQSVIPPSMRTLCL